MSDRVWAAQPRQDLYLTTYADVYESFYGGAAGGGKTDALLVYQAGRRLAFPRSKGLFLRRRFTDLSQPGAALDRFLELFGGIVKYDANAHEALWPNGSLTKFGYMESDADRYQYQGAQYDDVSWDELTQFSAIQYTYMFSRTRVRNPELARLGLRPQIRSAGNPGGIGHGWVKERFVDTCRETVIEDKNITVEYPDGSKIHPTRLFIPAKVDDNQALMQSDPMYKVGLQMLPEQERRALLDGDWDLFAGQFFMEYRRDIHVIPPFFPPLHWRRWIGFDWGYASPWVALFFAEDPDTKTVVVYRELSGTRQHDSEIAARILEAARGEEIMAMYAEPSIWARKNDTSTAQIMQQTSGWNIRLEPAQNDRLDGWRRVHEYLGWQPDGQGGVAVSPLLRIGENCTGLLRTLPMQIHDDLKVEDLDTHGDDHWVDALRYGLASRGILQLPSKFGSIVLLSR